jgi:hypothetical protein
MSLDVWLTVDEPVVKPASSGIFIREDGCNKEISIDEWNARFPGREPVVVVSNEELTTEVFSANITHNLNTMAKLAGLYEWLWHPKVTKASELIKPLAEGLLKLVIDPDKYIALNPANGWGKYENLVDFVIEYLGACVRYPDSKVNVSK